MTSSETSQATRLARPLCRRYIVSHFQMAAVKCREGDATRKRQVEWAFGWLPDGECEALGVWVRTEPGRSHGSALVDDLRIRGVERMICVIGTASQEVAAAFSSRTPRASIDRILAQALDASDCHGLPSPAHITAQIGDSLDRAIRRHGTFDSEAAAIDFIAVALHRAERRLDRERLALMRHLPLASSVRPMPLAA